MPIKSFNGFLIGLYVGEQFYDFSTINRSKININALDRDVNIEVINKRHLLTISTYSDKDKYMELYAPREKDMVAIAYETIVGLVNITLKDIRDNKITFEDEGLCAGIEFSGDYSKLNTKQW